jgi:hypothetical protein
MGGALSLLFIAGAILLFGYGLSVNLAPVDFGRVVGLYVAILFIMWQVINFIVFQVTLSLRSLSGACLLSSAALSSLCGDKICRFASIAAFAPARSR